MQTLPTRVEFRFNQVFLRKDGDYYSAALAPQRGDEHYAYYGELGPPVLLSREDFARIWTAIHALDRSHLEALTPANFVARADRLGDQLSLEVDGTALFRADGHGQRFDDSTRAPLLAIAEQVTQLHQQRTASPVLPTRLLLRLTITSNDGTDRYAFLWNGTTATAQHNEQSRARTERDFRELWTLLQTQSILGRSPWAIDFQFAQEQEPTHFRRYGLELQLNGVVALTFDINDRYFIQQPVYEGLRSWIESHSAN